VLTEGDVSKATRVCPLGASHLTPQGDQICNPHDARSEKRALSRQQAQDSPVTAKATSHRRARAARASINDRRVGPRTTTMTSPPTTEGCSSRGELPTLRDELLTLARNYGWEEQSGTDGRYHNLALYRPVGDQREWLELRFLNGKLTAVQHCHPMYCKPRNITQRKVDHVHALLRVQALYAEEMS
jgi:hypothetical protein